MEVGRLQSARAVMLNRICNLGLTASCIVIAAAIWDYRSATFLVAASAAGWFARATVEEW